MNAMGGSEYDRAPSPRYDTPPVQSAPAALPPPTCWKCGYNLSGVRVDGQCPECGNPIWSVPPSASDDKVATTAFILGISGVVTCVLCIGPLAIGLGIPAIILGRKASIEAVALQGRPGSSRGTARAAVILGWVTVGLSVLWGLFWGGLIAAEFLA
ncbi:MAG: DUF4190 domain-containing protein [Phycisphaeraceae bacterium]|nr:DUF4190 domain-containing protein [Phycisphaeraceae bacterium]